MLTDRERQIKRRMRDDFSYYAPRCLKIRTKDGAISPLSLNRAQAYFHERIEQQLAETGRVRALVLKGRQQGISTYTEGRFYWKTTHRKGVKAFILTHEDKATQNLFEMVNRYHENCPKVEKPNTGAANANELYFDRLDSGYALGTARTKGTGRSSTVQFFHGSEVAFWPNAEEHATGIMQAVPDTAGTEVILESTANGIGNYFHKLWQKAEAGNSDYIAVFIPWFWQPEYAKSVPSNFRLSEEEASYAEAYDLSLEQMVWVRSKLDDFGGAWPLFHQEYPATAALAFQFSGEERFIPPALVMAARKAVVTDLTGPIVAGLDPARGGGDRAALVVRHGRKVIAVRTWKDTSDAMGIVGLAVRAHEEFKFQRLFVDSTDGGYGIVDRLKEMGHEWAEKVSFGEGAEEPEKAINRRAEMWIRMRAWLKDAPVQIPDSDEIHADLMAPAEIPPDSHGRTKLQPKHLIKKAGFRSPDIADALALTFASTLAPIVEMSDTHAGSSHDLGWMAL